ncbi:hypothetical protein J5N97_007022 [Dioscorea zingiberensis]|uniref:Neprosin PEP catalytic domain-containing protein n=1 Tax=Dioscorea zingiberensis TaxID=325984 RepID=A0A9D5HU48_9LILI|nr:hypothetical protein J5N97_007022 [Dioscorea zingiberensis]
MMPEVLFYGLTLLCFSLNLASDYRVQAMPLDEANLGGVVNGPKLYPSESSPRVKHSAGYYLGFDKLYHGAKATISVYGIPDIKPDQSSAAAIWLSNTDAGGLLNEIVIGWHVHPSLYNDTKTHLFALWTTDGYKTSCYNLACGVFVSFDPKKFTLGSVIDEVSTYGGQQHDITLRIHKDKYAGNWWVSYGPSGEPDDLTPVGYLPGSIFQSLINNASVVIFGGRTAYPQGSSGPAMGSGHFPSEGWKKAALFENIKAVGEDFRFYPPDGAVPFRDKQDCYDVGDLRKSKFFFGGPAGCVK